MYLKTVMKGVGVGEIFQTGWFLKPAESFNQADLEEYVSNFIGLMVGSPELGVLRSFISPDQRWSGVSAYGYTDPRGAADFSAEGVIGSAQGGGAGSNLPLQTAVVVSIRTAHSGASYRGRMYFPATGRAVSTGHLYDNSSTDQICAAAANMIVNSKNAFASVGSHSDPDFGVYSPTKNIWTSAVRLTADNIPDTQRRRRDRLEATYSASHDIVHD